jgi:hypothetical protein
MNSSGTALGKSEICRVLHFKKIIIDRLRFQLQNVYRDQMCTLVAYFAFFFLKKQLSVSKAIAIW